MPRKDILESVYWRERGTVITVSIEPHSGSHRCCRVGRCAIADADALLFITGAGMGVGMSLPDFRSSEQFWEELAHPEISCYEDASDSAWFDKAAALAWGLNYHQLDAYRRAEPHEGHRVLHRLAQTKGPGGYFCSNVERRWRLAARGLSVRSGQGGTGASTDCSAREGTNVRMRMDA